MKATEAMKRYGICRQTLYRWAKFGLIEYEVLPSGRYSYGKKKYGEESETPIRTVAIYARVSTTLQKNNLARQIERLKQFATKNGMVIENVYSDIGSALNYNRRGYCKLLSAILEKKIETVLIEYKDRLVRIGFDEIAYICKKLNVNLIVIDKTEDKEKDTNAELTNDLMAIIHYFSSKMYSLRRNKKKIKELISC